MGDLGWVLPAAGAVQWMSGLILAVAVLRRGRLHGGAAFVPRALARIAVLLLVVAALDLVVALVAPRPFLQQNALDFLGTARWQIRTLLLLSAAAWMCILVAASWNGILGVGLRRRLAAAELSRRAQRVSPATAPEADRRPPARS